MPEPSSKPIITPVVSAMSQALVADRTLEAKMLCERCGAEMYRRHAVWRCPACWFKTDCCGW